MDRELLKKTADELTRRGGNVKGEVFRTHALYIQEKEGKEGLKKVEEEMKRLGIPFDFDKMESFEWVEESVSELVIIVAKEVFSWTDDDVFEMGRAAPKVSFIIKMLIRHLVSAEKIFNMAGYYWDKHFDFGSLEPVSFNEEKRQATVRIKGFKSHPLICKFHAGYFKGILEFVITTDIEVKETKCMNKNDPYHEYKVSWS